VNLRFNKSASSQQFLPHFALMMQRQRSDGITISFCVIAAKNVVRIAKNVITSLVDKIK